MQSLVVVIALLAIGACLGSFAATAGLRLARGEQSVFGRSRCDQCGVALGYLQTLPILSFAQTRGACAGCGGKIDRVHLLGELAGVAIVAAAIVVGLTARSILIATLGLALLASAVTDLKSQRLPDLLTLVVAVLGAALTASRSTNALWLGLAAGAIAFVVLEIVRRGFIALRAEEGLGFGDVKLISALAIWLGVATPWAVTFAALGALIASRFSEAKDRRIAFGPAIAAASFAVGALRDTGAAPWLS